MKELIGKKIVAMFVNQDQSILKFETTDGDMAFITISPCCSESWFADVVFSQGGIARQKVNEVLAVEHLEIPEWMNSVASRDGRGRQDYDTVYGYKIKFIDGNDIIIIYRNSSNGEYGGDCEFAGDRPYYKDLVAKSVWTEIKEDWPA